MSDWRPTGGAEALRARAGLLATIRDFFAERGVLEVDTPLLSQFGVTDPNIELFTVASRNEIRFLQSSPEYAMKRLLASGIGDIYQLGKAFRRGESGARHNPEFTLLEWYRIDTSHHELIREVAELVATVLPVSSWQVWSYASLFAEILNLDVFAASTETLSSKVEQEGISIDAPLSRLDYLDLLMTHCIEPRIAGWGLVFVTDFLPEQSALARLITQGGNTVAARFEAYYGGLELANGYWEEAQPDVLSARFAEDNAKRGLRGQEVISADTRLLHALEEGFPDCSGVALGFDRLLMLTLGQSSIAEVMPFGWDRA
jgi:lysyl-tRNA synthetase class 2